VLRRAFSNSQTNYFGRTPGLRSSLSEAPEKARPSRNDAECGATWAAITV